MGMVKKAVESFGRLDVAVNCAGVMDDNTAIADMSDEMLEKTFRINTFGLMYGLREECRQYLSQGDGGVIVNVCSVGATHQTAGAAYCASKGAVLAATKNTAFMYMEEGIRCNALSPGGVVTDIPLVMPPSDEFGFSRTSKLLDFSGELAMPEDLADAILFLASDQSRYVNGEEIKRRRLDVLLTVFGCCSAASGVAAKNVSPYISRRHRRPANPIHCHRRHRMVPPV